MKFSIHDFKNKSVVGEVEVSMESIEKGSCSDRFLSFYLARMDAKIHSQRKAKTKTQSEIRATTAKPFKQKGTGKARQGSTVAAHHRGGGTMFGPRGTYKHVKVPKGETRLAKRILLKNAISDQVFFVVENFELSDHKTKSTFSALKNFSNGAHLNCLMLYEGDISSNNTKSSSNIRGVKYSSIKDFSVNDLARSNFVLITKDALQNLDLCVR